MVDTHFGSAPVVDFKASAQKLRSARGPGAKDQVERAWKASQVFRAKYLPIARSFARTITGDPTMEVVLGKVPCTDGKTIYLPPPMELADRIDHDRPRCFKQDADGINLCPACHMNEYILAVILHEIAHRVGGTFLTLPPEEIEAVMQSILAANDRGAGSRIAKIIKMVEDSQRDYREASVMPIASVVSPFLPYIVNALEDARVNRFMHEGRKGAKRMFQARARTIITKGIENEETGEREFVCDRPLEAQASLAAYVYASGYTELMEFFSEETRELWQDEQLLAIAYEAQKTTSAVAVYRLSFQLLERFRELGLFKREDDPQDDPQPSPEPDDKTDDADADADSEADASDDSQPDDQEQDSQPDDQESGQPDDQEQDSGQEDSDADSQPDDQESGQEDSGQEDSGADDQEQESGQEDSAADDQEPASDQESGQEQDSQADDQEPASQADDQEDSGADDSDDSLDGDGAEDEDAAPAPAEDGEDADAGDEGDGDDADADDGQSDGQDDGQSDDGEEADDDADQGEASPEAGQDSGESDGAADEDEAEDAAQGEGAGDGAPTDDDDDFEAEDGDDDAEGEGGEAGESDQTAGDPDDDGDPWEDGDDERGFEDDAEKSGANGASDDDSDGESLTDDDFDDDDDAVASESRDGDPDDADDGDDFEEDEDGDEQLPGGSGDEPAETPEEQQSDIEEIEQLMAWLGGHQAGTFDIDKPISEVEQAAIDLAVSQIDHFDEASTTVSAVRWHAADKHIYVEDRDLTELLFFENDEYDLAQLREWQEEKGIDPTYKTPERIISKSLAKARLIFAENYRARKVTGLKSGRPTGRHLYRTATGNPLIFNKKHQPGRRDYFVILGIDASGSGTGYDGALETQKHAVMATAELLHRVGVPFLVLAQSGAYADALGGWGVDILTIRGEGEPWTEKQKDRLRKLTAMGNNLDGHTMEQYRKLAERSNATDKIILYFTDGAMPAANGPDELAVLQREIRTCRQKKIHLMGVGIGTDSPSRHGLDTVEIDGMEDIHLLVNAIEKRITK